MSADDWPTTRRFPHTIEEAFGPEKRGSNGLGNVMLCCAPWYVRWARAIWRFL